MNNILKFGLFLVLSVVLFSCKKKDAVEAREATSDAAATTAAATIYAVNTSSSVINWVGKKSFAPSQHNGTVKLANGKLALENGQLVAGEFEIDMNSIVDEDLKKAEMNAKLVGHLKSDDFFAVGTYPTAKFEITNVEKLEGNPDATHNITGNLTMRGNTKEITFPANVAIADGKLTGVTSEFTIDRTNWNVMYNAENAGIAKLAKDNIISNAITLRIMLNAEKTMM
jgi:polyisoprenoid-binding protein YceI